MLAASWSALLAVFVKELREALRDPNAFALSVLYPLLLYPGLLWAFSLWTEYQDGQQAGEEAAIAVVGAATEQVVALLEADDRLTVRETEDAFLALERGDVWAVVIATESADGLTTDTRWRSDRPASGRAKDAVESVLHQLRDDRIAGSVAAVGLSPAHGRFEVTHDQAAARRSLGPWVLSLFLPVALVLNAMIVGFYPTIEVAVGERERRTLETTLVCAAPRGALVAGKLVSVLFIVTIATLVNLGTILLSGWHLLHLLHAEEAIELQLSLWGWLGVLGCALTAGMVLQAWVLLAALRARDFKQAQNIATFFLVAGTSLAALGALEGFGTELGMGLVPVTNLVAVMREGIAGRPFGAAAAIALVENLCLIGVPIAIAARVVAGESWRSRGGSARA